MRQLETQLKDRILRFDGVSILKPEQIAAALSRGVPIEALRVVAASEDVERFNLEVPENQQLKVASQEPISVQMDWQLPEHYKNLDLGPRIFKALETRLPALGYDDSLIDQAIQRIDAELLEILKRGMSEFIRTIIYILDTFREKDIVWGVGRGSSCACYILFVLGLHVVDCVKLDVPMSEFFHD